MRWKAYLTTICAGALLASCAPTGDLCLSTQIIRPSAATADLIAATDRAFAEALLAHNEVYAASCTR